jgi:hypothetical protein
MKEGPSSRIKVWNVSFTDRCWFVTPCRLVDGYKRFGGTSPWRWRRYDPTKHWYPHEITWNYSPEDHIPHITSKSCPAIAMQASRREEYSSSFLTSAQGGRWLVSVTPRPCLLTAKKPWYARLGEPQSPSGPTLEGKSFTSAWDRTPGLPVYTEVQIIMQFSPPSCYVLTLASQYCSQHFVLKYTLSLCPSLRVKDTC